MNSYVSGFENEINTNKLTINEEQQHNDQMEQELFKKEIDEIFNLMVASLSKKNNDDEDNS